MRIGRFKIKQRMLRSKEIDKKFYLQVLFTTVIISKKKIDSKKKEVEYTAICDQFEDIAEGEAIPEYTFKIIRKENRIEFMKVA